MESLKKKLNMLDDDSDGDDVDLEALEFALNNMQLRTTRSMSKQLPLLLKKTSSRIFKDKKEEVKMPASSKKIQGSRPAWGKSTIAAPKAV